MKQKLFKSETNIFQKLIKSLKANLKKFPRKIQISLMFINLI